MHDFLLEQWFPIALFILSTALSYWFWKNPVDSELKNKRVVEASDEEMYVTGTNVNGWVVQKILSENVEKQLPYSFQATRKNNPSVIAVPQVLDDLRKLNYEER